MVVRGPTAGDATPCRRSPGPRRGRGPWPRTGRPGTTHADDATILPALRAGALGYLTKDTSAEQIEAAIRAVHAGQTHLDPAVQEHLVATVISRAPDPPEGGNYHQQLPAGLTWGAEVLALLAAGLSNPEIAQRLFVSNATVKTHINRIFAKTGARDRAPAAPRPSGTPTRPAWQAQPPDNPDHARRTAVPFPKCLPHGLPARCCHAQIDAGGLIILVFLIKNCSPCAV